MEHLLDISSVGTGLLSVGWFYLLRVVQRQAMADKSPLAKALLLIPQVLSALLLGQLTVVLLWNL